jgi:hypothetical protein
LFDDLPDALASRHGRDLAGRWRVHFHVPIYMDRIGSLGTTRGEIEAVVRACGGPVADRPEQPVENRLHQIRHWEVETYAWEVLPDDLRPESLAEGIARELAWFKESFTPRNRPLSEPRPAGSGRAGGAATKRPSGEGQGHGGTKARGHEGGRTPPEPGP